MDKKQHGAEKAKSVADTIMSKMRNLQPESMKAPSSDAAGWKAGYGEYGAEMAKRQKSTYKMKAKDANLHLFQHKAAGYAAVKLDEVRKASGLSEDSKRILSRYAHCAWELRAEVNQDGEQEQYFVLREDIELK
jgi:hypothetical protein